MLWWDGIQNMQWIWIPITKCKTSPMRVAVLHMADNTQDIQANLVFVSTVLDSVSTRYLTHDTLPSQWFYYSPLLPPGGDSKELTHSSHYRNLPILTSYSARVKVWKLKCLAGFWNWRKRIRKEEKGRTLSHLYDHASEWALDVMCLVHCKLTEQFPQDQ